MDKGERTRAEKIFRQVLTLLELKEQCLFHRGIFHAMPSFVFGIGFSDFQRFKSGFSCSDLLDFLFVVFVFLRAHVVLNSGPTYSFIIFKLGFRKVAHIPMRFVCLEEVDLILNGT